MRFTDAVADAGITYRQADWWVGCRWVEVSALGGSGSQREISHREALVLRRMGVLVHNGGRASIAADIARQTVERGVAEIDLPGGLHIAFQGVAS